MKGRTNGMQVVRRGYTWQVEHHLMIALPSCVLYAIFRLPLGDTGAGAFLCAFLEHGFSIFVGGVRGGSDGLGLVFGWAWSL